MVDRPHRHSGQIRLGTNGAAFADHGPPLQVTSRIDHRVPADDHIRLNVSVSGIDDGHAVQHVFPQEPPGHGGFRLGQLDAVVHAHGFFRIADDLRRDALSPLPQDGNHVRKIVFTLIIVVFHLGEGVEEQAIVEAYGSGEHFAHFPLLRRSVLVFHDPENLSPSPRITLP